MVALLIEDFSFDVLAPPVKNELEGITITGLVDCQTTRRFGIDDESFEYPVYLDTLVEKMGAEVAGDYDQKVAYGSGVWHFKSQKICRPGSRTSSNLLTTMAQR